jgi:hypothetical protein
MFVSYGDAVPNEGENFVEKKWWLSKFSGGQWISNMLWNCPESLVRAFQEAATFVGQHIKK